MLASELYALTQSRKCEGNEECHWCGGKSDGSITHDDPGRQAFLPYTGAAKRLQARAVCQGCFLWRMGSISIHFLSDSRMRDRQKAKEHSWFITTQGAWAIEPSDFSTLYSQLLRPPRIFCLSLRTDQRVDNHLHEAIVNENETIKADTPLHFTLNNANFTYSVYDLEQAQKTGEKGREPGTRAILKLLEDYDFSPPKPEVITTEEGNVKELPQAKKSQGRPPTPDSPKRAIR